MRIIAGSHRGRVLRAPPGDGTRPTSDRVRQAIFNVLGPPPDDCNVLDVFAGSGAMALEALSRGAAHATMIDHHQQAVATIKANVNQLGVSDLVTVLPIDFRKGLEAVVSHQRTFDWVFIDPPYRQGLADAALELLSPTMLRDEAVVVVEHDRREQPSPSNALKIRTQKTYGDTIVTYYCRA